MGLLDLFRRTEKALTLSDFSWIPLPTAAGVTVTADNALKSPTSLACFRLLVDTISTLPCHIYERTADGKKRAENHPAEKFLTGFATPWLHNEEMRARVTGEAILRGDGLAQVVRVRGNIREIHPLPSASVTIETDEVTGEPRYTLALADGGKRELPWRDVIHLSCIVAGTGKSRSIIDCAREAIGVDIAMATHQAKLFANGARPAGVLKVPGRLTDPAIKRIRENWDSKHGGPGNSGNTAILEGDVSYVPLALSSTDAQFLELRKFAVDDVCRAFGVPPVLAGSLERAVWKNVTELNQQFATMTLRPWLSRWQAALERALLTDKERETHYCEFVVDDLVRADIRSRFEAFYKSVGGPWMTANEARAADNHGPIEGGDKLLRPLNSAPADETPPPDEEDDA